MKIKKLFKIDPLKGFIELPILWFVVIILFSIACMVSVIIIFNSNLQISLDYNGFNNFVEIFKVPLGILAIIITFIAFLATAHRSAQTKEQILSSNRQNVFSNYYKHIEEFEKYIIGILDNKKISINNLRITHKILFSKADQGDYTLNKNYLEDLEIKLKQCQHYFELFNFEGEKSVNEIFFNVYKIIDDLFHSINLKIDRSGRQYFFEGKRFITPDETVRNAIEGIKKEIQILKQIISFDNKISFPNQFDLLAGLNTNNVPAIKFISETTNQVFDLFEH